MQSNLLKINKTFKGKTFAKFSRMKDSDGDGVPNRFDCQPYNPNKQGLIHNLVQDYKERKAGREEVQAGATESDINKRYRSNSPRAIGAREELIKQKAQDAYYKEKEKVAIKHAQERAHGGGWIGQINSLLTPPKPSSPRVIHIHHKRKKHTTKHTSTKKHSSPISPPKQEYNPFLGR